MTVTRGISKPAYQQRAETPGKKTSTISARLQSLQSALEEKIAVEAPHWLCEDESGSVVAKVPWGYFEPFSNDVAKLLSSWTIELEKNVRELRHRMAENTKAYMQELTVYRDKLAPWKRGIDVSCNEEEEEVYIYEPLKYLDEDLQKVVRDVIDERVLQLLTKGVPRKPAVKRELGEGEEYTDAEKLDMAKAEMERLKQALKDMEQSLDSKNDALLKANQARKDLLSEKEQLLQGLNEAAKNNPHAGASRGGTCGLDSEDMSWMNKAVEDMTPAELEQRRLYNERGGNVNSSGGGSRYNGPGGRSPMGRDGRSVGDNGDGGAAVDQDTVKMLRAENEQLKRQVWNLERTIAELKKQFANSGISIDNDPFSLVASTMSPPLSPSGRDGSLSPSSLSNCSGKSRTGQSVFDFLHGDARDRTVKGEDTRSMFHTHRQTTLLSLKELTRPEADQDDEGEDSDLLLSPTSEASRTQTMRKKPDGTVNPKKPDGTVNPKEGIMGDGFSGRGADSWACARGADAWDSRLSSTSPCSQLWAAAMQLKRVGSEGRLQVRLRGNLPDVLDEQAQRLVGVKRPVTPESSGQLSMSKLLAGTLGSGKKSLSRPPPSLATMSAAQADALEANSYDAAGTPLSTGTLARPGSGVRSQGRSRKTEFLEEDISLRKSASAGKLQTNTFKSATIPWTKLAGQMSSPDMAAARTTSIRRECLDPAVANSKKSPMHGSVLFSLPQRCGSRLYSTH